MKGLFLPTLLAALIAGQVSARAMSLDDALQRAVSGHPSLEATRYEILAAEADADQAGLPLNPELEAEVENVAGSGEYTGADAAEYTMLLNQTVQLGGKRAHQRAEADLSAEIARAELELARRELEAGVTAAFFTALAAQEEVLLAEKMEQIGEDMLDQTKRRVDAGGSSPLELSKAELELAHARAALSDAEGRRQSARSQLAAFWGGTGEDMKSLNGDLFALEEIGGESALLSSVERHPSLIKAEAEVRRAKASLTLENAQRLPDLTVGAGVRLDEASSDHAFLFRAAIPLGVVNRNQGGRAAAGARLQRAEAELEVARRDIRNRILEAAQAYSQARAAAQIINDDLLPAARRAFELAREGYNLGRFAVLDLLDAERSLFEIELRRISAVLDLHAAAARVRFLSPATPQAIPTHQESP